MASETESSSSSKPPKRKDYEQSPERATGIAPDEPTELDQLTDQIIALEESSDAELQDGSNKKAAKLEIDRAKAEDTRMKAMERLSETKKRESEAGECSTGKRQTRSGGDAFAFLSERATLNYEMKEKELDIKREQQELQKRQLEASMHQQLQQQQQQTEMLKLMQQQQQQSQHNRC